MGRQRNVLYSVYYTVYSCCVIIINTAYLKTGGIYCIIGKGSMFSSEDGSIINLYCHTYMDSFLNRNVLLGIYSKHNLSIAKKFYLTTTKNVTDSDPFDGFQIRARLWSWSDYTVCIVYSVYILTRVNRLFIYTPYGRCISEKRQSYSYNVIINWS